MKTLHMLFLLVVCLPAFLLLATPALAQSSYQHGNTVTLGRQVTIANDYFASGNTVTISGTVTGDAYIVGGTVIVDGTIGGDLLAAGGTVIVRGSVAHNVRVVGGQVMIEGNVGGNTTVASGTTIFAKDAKLVGNLVAAAGSLTISAPLNKDATLAAGNITLDSTILGNVTASDGTLLLTPNAKVTGNVVYVSQNLIQFQNQDQIAGTLTHKFPPQKTQQPRPQTTGTMFGLMTGFALVIKIVSFLASLFLGILIIHFLPVYSQKTAQLVTKKFWQGVGIGFIAMVATPIIIVILLMTIIGIPLAVLLIAAAVCLAIVAKLFVFIAIGQKLSELLKQQTSVTAAFCIGLVAYALVTMIPVVGWIIGILVTMVGVGTILMQKKYYYTLLRSQQLI